MDLNVFAEKSALVEYTYKVTPEVYYSFQRCSNDYNPLHTDENFAIVKGFKGKVMYGNILNAFVSHFVGMLLPSREVMILTQDINFRKPVFMDDEIALESTIEEVSDAAGYVLYKLRFKRLIGDGKKELIASGHVRVGLLNN